MTTADQIADLEAILNAGGKRVSTEGLTVDFDPEEIRRRLAALRQKADASKRPRIGKMNLSNF